MSDHRDAYRTSSRRYGRSRSRSPRTRDTKYRDSNYAHDDRTRGDASRGNWIHDRYSEAEPPQTKKSRWDVGDPGKDLTGVLAERSAPGASSNNALQQGYISSRGRSERAKDLGSELENTEHATKRGRSASISSSSSSSSSASYHSRHKRYRRRRSRPRVRSRSNGRSRSRSHSRDRSRSSHKHGGSGRRDKEKKEKRKDRERKKDKHRRRSRSPKGERRSILTGKKIKMKVHKTVEDYERDEKREQLLQFLNSAYE